MATKILTQAEIDALLSTAADGGRGRRAAADEVVRYNFRRPDRVSKEQVHALQFLHERCARNLSTSLSAYMRTTIYAVGVLRRAVLVRGVSRVA